MSMHECARHRGAVVRYGPMHPECPMCVLQRRADALIEASATRHDASAAVEDASEPPFTDAEWNQRCIELDAAEDDEQHACELLIDHLAYLSGVPL